MDLLTKNQVIIRIVCIIASAEFLIMLALSFIPLEMNALLEAMADVTLLATFSTPAIYIWIVKPFVNARDAALIQISELAFTDSLTELPNRRHLLSHLDSVISSSVRHKVYGALLIVDLDGFKLVNDTYGHDAGDAILIEIAKRFRSSVRTEHFVGRLGGDEFVILLEQLDTSAQGAQDKALLIADKLIALANIPLDFNGNALHVGASIGISLIGFERLDADAVISKADIAMYQAKNAGKGCAVFADNQQ